MAYHGLLNMDLVQALNVDALNRSAVCAADLDNGNAVVLASISATAGEGEVWTATQPATATLAGCWIVADPEVVVTYSGNSAYKGLDPDPRNFYVKATKMFRAFKPQLGDVIELNAEAFTAGAGAGSAFANLEDGSYKFIWAGSAGSGLSLKLIGTTYISLADGSIGTQRVTMYKFVVVVL
jgi:hypothetical protein